MPCGVLRRSTPLVCLLAALVAVAINPTSAGASTVRYRTDAELIALSERVVHARVLKQRTARPAGPDGAIYTVTTLAVLEDFTGVAGDTIDVWELGGAFGGEYMFVGGAVEYVVGGDVLVCLDRGRFGLRSLAMGFSMFDVQAVGVAGGTTDGLLRRHLGDTTVIGGAVQAGERSLADFRNLSAQVRGVPSRRNPEAEALQPDALPSFTFLPFSNGLGPRWVEADSGIPVKWFKNTSALPPLTSGDAVSEIQNALAAWTTPSTATIVLQYGGTTNQTDPGGPWNGISNGNGVISFEDPNDEISGSTLAIGGGFATYGNGGTINGTTFNRYTRGFVIFQNAADLDATYKGSLGFGRVLEHEIGHGIGLGHTQLDGTVPNPSSNIMYPSCCSSSTPVPPALGPDDLAGLNFIYPVGPICNFSLSPSSSTATVGGGAGSVSVAAGSGCAWTASSNAAFVSITSGASGSGSGTVGYSVGSNADQSQRTGTLTIAGRTFTITQAGTLTGAGPTMSIDKPTLQFAAANSGAVFTQQTQPQAVQLMQTGAGTVTWTATPGSPWITVSPSSGSGPATISVGVAFSSGLPITGTVTGSVALSFSGAGSTPGPVNVVLTLSQGSAAPFGLVDTPADGLTGVTGSLPITGWALDDVEVQRVRLVRDPVAGEGTSPIFIGLASFVEGARPDVGLLYPTMPRNSRAGWGYLLLTNFLPNQGNGTFRLLAYADDANGHSTLLGARTITCTNSAATLPFGAIDTPGQGETISGTSYNNFGWVLSPGARRADPPGGGTVSVVIDGAFLGTPIGWGSRPDLTSLFPLTRYAGIGTSLGVYTFDPSLFGQGTHTIAWVVTDDQGGAQGVGSRYFTVASGSSGSVRPQEHFAPAPLRADVNAAPVDRSDIQGRRGFDLATPLRAFSAASDRATVHGEELDRFELHLTASDRTTGYVRVGDDLGPLPVGSHLDPATGEFTWQTGVGFVGTYDLVFVRWGHGHALARQDVRIVIGPKSTGRVGPQIVIDTPGGHAGVVAQPFVVAGWAIDGDAYTGTGIDTLHVWAYPVSGCGPSGAVGSTCDPIFLGEAAYGGDRPDVAVLFGDRFRGSGYGLSVGTLPPGSYDLAVFAWSTATDGFVPARTVRVTVR